MGIATRAASPNPPTMPDADREPDRPIDRCSEARLRAAAVAGDRAAFAALYAAYRDNVFQYLIRRCAGDRHLAEDLTHDTFIRALRGLPRYREMGRPFGAWLVTIAGNLLADHWKSGWHRFQVPWSDVTGEGYDGRLSLAERSDQDPAWEVAAQDSRRRAARVLADAIGKLPDRQQQVVSLRYAEGLSVADTALKLGVDQGAVKAATYRARQTLADNPALEQQLAQLR